MRMIILPLLALLLFAPLGVAQQYSVSSADDAATTVPLKMKVYRNWKIRLPSEQWSTVGTRFAMKEGLGADFKAHLDGTALAVDINADGKVDTKVEDPSGVLILANGDRRYAVRVKNERQQWRFAPACAMLGKVGNTRIRLIDQNNNGRFDDFGADAMVIGKGKVASFLSRVVSIDSKLYEIEVKANGSNISLKPFMGKTSTLKLNATTRGKVVAAVVQSKDKKFSFGFAKDTNELLVPAQDYVLHSGTIAFGGNSVQVKAGRAKHIAMPADGSGTITWGGPVRAEFTYTKKFDELTFDPNKIWFFGKAGEEYYGWNPLGKSPKITLNTTSGRELAQAYFPGS